MSCRCRSRTRARSPRCGSWPASSDAEITLLDKVLADLLAGHEGYRAIQALPGIGPVLAAVIVAEIGDIRRFPGPGQLGCWAGLTPRHYESDTKVIRGHVTKQGSRMLRWAVTEAIQRQPAGSRPRRSRTPSSPAAARRQRTSPRSPPPASCSPWSTTACATGASAAWPAAAAGRMTARGPGARPPAILPPATGREAAEHSAPRRLRHARPPGGAGAHLIGPARSLTRTRPMPPGQHAPGTNEGMNAASGLPGRTTGHGATTTAYTSDPLRGSFPAGLDHRLAGTCVKDASGAGYAAGLRPVLDPAARSHEHGTCAEKGRATRPLQHALQTPLCRETAGRNPA